MAIYTFMIMFVIKKSLPLTKFFRDKSFRQPHLAGYSFCFCFSYFPVAKKTTGSGVTTLNQSSASLLIFISVPSFEQLLCPGAGVRGKGKQTSG